MTTKTSKRELDEHVPWPVALAFAAIVLLLGVGPMVLLAVMV